MISVANVWKLFRASK